MKYIVGFFVTLMDFLVLWLTLEMLAQTTSSFDINWKLVAVFGIAIIGINVAALAPPKGNGN